MGWGKNKYLLCLPSKLIRNIISITKGNSLFLTVNLTVSITEHLATVERDKLLSGFTRRLESASLIDEKNHFSEL